MAEDKKTKTRLANFVDRLVALGRVKRTDNQRG